MPAALERDTYMSMGGCMSMTKNLKRQGYNSGVRRALNRFIPVALVLLFPAIACSNEGDLQIVRDGRATAVVIQPAREALGELDRHYNDIAVEWLVDYIEKATGVRLEVLDEDPEVIPDLGTFISVGHTAMAREAGITTDGLEYHACRLAVRGNTLFLIGNDRHGPRRRPNDAWHMGPKGTCRAVTLFLEDYLDVRWFAPGPMGTRIPSVKDLAVPADLDRTWKPVFTYVHMHRAYEDGSPAALANNIAQSVMIKEYGGHTWDQWVPASRYYDTHPEYFALLDERIWPLQEGEIRQRPSSDIRGHLCTSNPDTQRIMAEAIRGYFDQGFEWVALGQTDGWQPCRCEDCEAMDNYVHWIPDFRNDRAAWRAHLDENPCERLFQYHQGIIDDVAESHPDGRVLLLGYQASLVPPQTISHLGENVIMEMAVGGDFDAILAPWKDHVDAIHVYNNAFWLITKPAGILPKHSPELATRDINKMLDYGVRSLYMGGCGENWALEGIAYYTVCRLFGDPELDIAEPMREYCDFIYGEAADEMLEFYGLMFDRITKTRDAYHEQYNFRFVFTGVFTPELVEAMEKKLSAAEAKAAGERARGWLGQARLYFDYLKTTVMMMDAYERFSAAEDADTLLDLKAAFDDWMASRVSIVERAADPDYVEKWFPHARFVTRHGLHLARGRGGLMYQEPPVTLDFKELFIRYGIIDQLGLDSVARAGFVAAPPVIDGRIEPEEWEAKAFFDIPEIDGAGRVIPSRFSVRYDEENLYFAFVCAEPLPAGMILDAGDSAARAAECEAVEILLAPGGAAQEAVYFMFVPGAEHGFSGEVEFGDGLGPAVPEDLEIAHGITVHSHVEPEGERWVVEVAIPFSRLGIDAPQQGEAWPFDIGRRRWATWRRPLARPHLYRWSYNSVEGSPPVIVFEGDD